MNNGFTLLELVVTMVVAAILAALAGPSMYAMLQDNRLTSQTNDFVSDFKRGQNEAVKRSRTITMCPIDPTTDFLEKCTASVVASADCENACDFGSNAWQHGWVIFVNKPDSTGSTANKSTSKNDEILWIRTPMPDSFSFAATGGKADDYIEFFPSGRTTADTLVLELSATPELSGRKMKRCMVIPISGRIRSLNPNYDTDPACT